ncbi:MAG TPA: hypothetical protein VJ793_24115 [Anaerolineae bacterium]|nr:hypothetical protein [Anaerolineae bacterium]
MLERIPVKQPGNYCAYLVRFWQDGPHASWRAFAKNVLTEEEHHFASIEELFVFLQGQTIEDHDQEV